MSNLDPSAIPDLISVFQRLLNVAARLDNIHHSGCRVPASEWAELFAAVNFSRAALEKVKK
jgi:hypothetical protein